MSRKPLKNQKQNKTEKPQESAPTAADFLQQNQSVPAEQIEPVEKKPEEEPNVTELKKTPEQNPKPAKPAPPKKKSEQKRKQNDRVTTAVSVKENQIHAGDPCGSGKKCPGNYIVLSSIRIGKRRIRHLACSICNFKPKNNKEVMHLP